LLDHDAPNLMKREPKEIAMMANALKEVVLSTERSF
jgi:hypothetical protein